MWSHPIGSGPSFQNTGEAQRWTFSCPQRRGERSKGWVIAFWVKTVFYVPLLPGLLPLDIVGMPEYEKLSEPERVLCTELRLLPSVFAELRAKLKVWIEISFLWPIFWFQLFFLWLWNMKFSFTKVESSARGGLLLAEAREALKIDVNKTRLKQRTFMKDVSSMVDVWKMTAAANTIILNLQLKMISYNLWIFYFQESVWSSGGGGCDSSQASVRQRSVLQI